MKTGGVVYFYSVMTLHSDLPIKKQKEILLLSRSLFVKESENFSFLRDKK